ncbi:Protein of unknown function [Pseudomonas helmanticensis]|uniref:Uncharacterized protein n=1 Tax=Pseudomonas helmanticensis TaxID=1471381 RepID=A0ACD2UD74_9PSED|nr:DUF2790 domain-containing protein [Pseudomonas helmanticensis]SMQ30385.1 Protein of unknown function [Pseudomonas helmanticensis]
MKKILLLAMSITASLSAYAQQATASPEVVPYDYGMHLDISQVINISPIADVCGPTAAEITYKDSQGEVHILGYSVMGTGCSN